MATEAVSVAGGGVPQPAPHRFTRSLSGFGVIILTLSVLSPGVSVLVSGGSILQQAGTGAVAAFVLGGIFCYVQTALAAEIGSAYPTAGYDYAAIGHSVGDWAGVVTYLAGLVSTPLFLNTSAVGIAVYLAPFGIPLSAHAITFVTIAVIVGLSLLNIRANEYLTGLFMLIEFAVLALISVIGIWHAQPNSLALVLQPMRVDHGLWVATGIGVLGIAINNACWAISGASQALMFSEDMRRPRTIGRIIMLAFALTVVFETAPVIGTIVGSHDLKAVLSSDSLFETFLGQYFGGFLLKFVSLSIAIAIFNACLAGFIGIGRNYYSMGRTRLFAPPINHALMRLIVRTDAPWVAILWIGTVTALATYLPMTAKLMMLSGNGVIVGLFYAWGVFAGRRSGRTGHAPYRTPLYPLIPVLGVVLGLAAVAVIWMDADIGRKSLLIYAGVYGLAYLYYRVVLLRRPGGWTMTGPADIDAMVAD